MIHDAAMSIYVNDSFKIAVYLGQRYSQSDSRLFSSDSIDIHHVFNAHVNALFLRYVILCLKRLSFNLKTAKVSKIEFMRRLHVSD